MHHPTNEFAEGLKNGQLRPPQISPAEHWEELRQSRRAFAIIPASPPGTDYDRVAIDNVSLTIEVNDLELGASYYEGWLRTTDSATNIRWDAVVVRGGDRTRSSELLLAKSRLLAMRYRVPAFLFHPADKSSVYRVDVSGLTSIGDIHDSPHALVSSLLDSGEVCFESIRSAMGVMDRRVQHTILQAKKAPLNNAYELIRDDTKLYGKKWVQHAIRSEAHQRSLAEHFGKDALVHACRLYSVNVLVPNLAQNKESWMRDWVIHAIFALEYQKRHLEKFGYDALVEGCHKYDAPIGFSESGEQLAPRDPRLRTKMKRATVIKTDDLQDLYRKNRHHPSLLSPYTGADVVQSDSSYLVLDHSRAEVCAFLTFDEAVYEGAPLLTAEQIWRNREVRESAEARNEVFWKVIFPIHERVATGNIESDLGQGFWHHLIVDALKMGLKVYFVELQELEPVTEIMNHHELEVIHHSISGQTSANRHRMIVISRTPLKGE